MHDNMKIWDNLKQVPPACLKKIAAGRLKGKSSVEPQWRLQAMTNQFGPCGIGWKYVIVDKRIIDGSDGIKCGFVDIELYFKFNGEWSEAIPGTGGSQLVAKESGGMHTSDEVFKMALTDALSVAMKAIGVASDIYMGAFDGVKYSDTSWTTNDPIEKISDDQKTIIRNLLKSANRQEDSFLAWQKVETMDDILTKNFDFIVKTLTPGANK